LINLNIFMHFYNNISVLKYFTLNITNTTARIRKVLTDFSYKIKKIQFSAGSVLEILYFKKHIPVLFEGICLGIKKKSFFLPNTGFYLRNVVLSVPLELICTFFYNRLYNYLLKDYKRKIVNSIKSSKMYYVRNLKNQ